MALCSTHSAANAYGWRVWRNIAGRLVSPYVSTTRRMALSASGLIDDHDGDGIYYYPLNIPAEFIWSRLEGYPAYAVSLGIVEGWTAPDFGAEHVIGAKRTNRYKARAIFTAEPDKLRSTYPDIPVWTLDKMPAYQQALKTASRRRELAPYRQAEPLLQ